MQNTWYVLSPCALSQVSTPENTNALSTPLLQIQSRTCAMEVLQEERIMAAR